MMRRSIGRLVEAARKMHGWPAAPEITGACDGQTATAWLQRRVGAIARGASQ